MNGKQVEKVDSDSGDTSTDTASQSVDRLLSNNVDAIVGAASSSVSLSVIDKIIGAGVVRDLAGQHLRRAHDVRRQGPVLPHRPAGRAPGPRSLGDNIVADGNSTVGIMALQDSYGTGPGQDR